MRLIDADALAHDLEYDVELCAEALDDMNMVGKEREDMQFQKDCKQNCIWYISEQPTVDAIPIEWIPVNERLPKDEGSYIVSCTQADISYSSTSGFIYDVDGNPEWLDEFGVVAWMPLPTPYERKED